MNPEQKTTRHMDILDNIPEERLPRRSAIEAVKEAVRIAQVAAEYGSPARSLGRVLPFVSPLSLNNNERSS